MISLSTRNGLKIFVFLLFEKVFKNVKQPHTQTFNGEVEFAGVLTSIGGHPALPQPSLLGAQTRDLKQGRAFI